MKKIALIICLAIALGGVSPGIGTADENDNRAQIVVISDIHLGADDAIGETTENKGHLLAFLKRIRASETVAELVIAGDLIDQWFLPMQYEMPGTLSDFNDLVAKNNQEIFDEINLIIQDGAIKVTYVPGNHDINFDETEADRLFPAINQARDAHGLGTYIAGSSDIVIEHGHRYNIFVSPDPLSNRDIVSDANAILPCGYFFTRIATSSAIAGKPDTDNAFAPIAPRTDDSVQMGYYSLYKIWENLMTAFPVSERFDEKIIRTNIDGYSGVFAVHDLIPFQKADGDITVKLYHGIIENWEQRQALNLVQVPTDAQEALMGAASTEYSDSLAARQYFDIDPAINLVVFGHTHEAKLIKMKNLEGADVLYANSGTWVDHWYDFPTRTYLLIGLAEKEMTVSLRQMSFDGTSITLSQETIMK